MRAKDIFEYIEQQEILYKKDIQVNDVWFWNMREHIEDRSIYKNSQIRGDKHKGTIDEVPIKNIMRPVLNLKYRAEDIELKEITLYIDDPDKHHLSFLVKKYHDDVYVLENDLDTFFDKVKESKIDLGAGLAKDLGGGKLDYVPLESIAFCDQHKIMDAPIGILHKYSPGKLKEFEKVGWGKPENGATMTIDEFITLVANEKGDIPGPDIQVYEVQGVLPTEYLDDKTEIESVNSGETYDQQMQIVAFYKNQQDERMGVILYRKKKKNPFKMAEGEEIFNRSLPWGGIEELMESQVWITYSEKVKKDFLDSASKTLAVTDDPTLAQKHPTGMKEMDNMEIIELQEGKTVKVLDTYPRNIALFEQAVMEWQEHAKEIGSAPDALRGVSPAAGTPFRLEERVVQEGKGIHEYRRGKYAKWIEEVYRDWIIPFIVKKITEGTKFLSELSLDELQGIAENVARLEGERLKSEKILAGKTIEQIEVDDYKEKIKKEFMDVGTKQFVTILKNQLKDIPVKIKINVAGKQKDLGLMADRITNIFQQIFSNPEGFFKVMAIPGASKSFNEMLEYSGMNPMDFSWASSPQEIQQEMQQQPQPQQKQIQQPIQKPINNQLK